MGAPELGTPCHGPSSRFPAPEGLQETPEPSAGLYSSRKSLGASLAAPEALARFDFPGQGAVSHQAPSGQASFALQATGHPQGFLFSLV